MLKHFNKEYATWYNGATLINRYTQWTFHVVYSKLSYILRYLHSFIHANVYTYCLVAVLYTISLYIELPKLSYDGNVSHKLNSIQCKKKIYVYAYSNWISVHAYTWLYRFIKYANISATYIFGKFKCDSI